MQAAPLAYEFWGLSQALSHGKWPSCWEGQRRVGVRVGPSAGVGSQLERTINAEARGQAGPPPPPCSPSPASSGTVLPHLQASLFSSVKWVGQIQLLFIWITFIYLDHFYLFFWACSMWELTSLTRDQIQAPAVGKAVLTTRPLRKWSQMISFRCKFIGNSSRYFSGPFFE